jgi:hypothetical protein
MDSCIGLFDSSYYLAPDFYRFPHCKRGNIKKNEKNELNICGSSGTAEDSSLERQKRKPVAYKVRPSKVLMQESIAVVFFPDSSGIRHEGNCYIVIMADS